MSPFFSRDVLCEILQHHHGWRDRVSPWLKWSRLVPATVVAAVLLVAGLSWERAFVPATASDGLPDAIAQMDPIDFEVVANLDDLLAAEDESPWTDGDVSTL